VIEKNRQALNSELTNQQEDR